MTLNVQTPTPAAKGINPPHAVSRGVLVVEDEFRLRDMLCRAVHEMGFAATPAPTAEAAIRILETQVFGILVLDLNLPGMGGMELLEAVRDSHPHLQVIILTGFGDLEAAKRAIRFDIVDFLTKPCALGTLEIALDRARRRSLKAGSPEQAELPAEPVLQFTPPPAPTAGALSLEELEQQHILSVLAKNAGNRTLTANQLGISLRKLYYRLEQYQREGLLP